MSARYDTAANVLMDVSTSWVGRPLTDREKVYALFDRAGTPLEGKEPWYVYGISHDAIHIKYEDLPEVVRMAYLLMQ